MVGNVKEALVPFVKQKVKEWKLKKEEAKAKKELEQKEGKDKGAADKKSDKPKELDSPLMNQAEIESTMAEYEVTRVQTNTFFVQHFIFVMTFTLNSLKSWSGN